MASARGSEPLRPSRPPERHRTGALELWYGERMTTRASWGSLELRIEGELVLPGSPDFDVAYRALNARFDDVQPLAIVRCTNPDDVAEVIRFAGTHGMEVGTRGGGHCFGGRSSSGGLLVDVTRMHAVEVSGGAVTVGGGTRIGEVYASLLQHDLAIPAGSCPSVGIAGLALGGGLGIIGRRYGLTSDHLLGAQIVLADGRIVECDEHHEEDLFWALRGAGAGNFGVVTSLTFGTIPAPAATNFHLAWSFSEAAAAIDAWQSWAPAAPEELSASLLIGASAHIEEPPSVDVIGVLLGPESEATDLVEALVGRARSEPDLVFLSHMSFEETTRYWGERASREPAEGDPSGTGRVFPNFPDPDLKDWASAYFGTNLERLLSLKARYDPGNLLRFRQSLPVR